MPDSSSTSSRERPTVPEAIDSGFPLAIWKFMVLAFAILFAAAFIMFHREASSIYVVTVSIGIATMCFGLPALIMHTEHRHRHGPHRDLGDLMQHGVRTGSGPVEGREALLQVLLIPFSLMAAMMMIGFLDVILRT